MLNECFQQGEDLAHAVLHSSLGAVKVRSGQGLPGIVQGRGVQKYTHSSTNTRCCKYK
mgnify:FL=1